MGWVPLGVFWLQPWKSSPARAVCPPLLPRHDTPCKAGGGPDLWGVVGGTQDPGPSRLERWLGAAPQGPQLAPGGRRAQWGQELGTRRGSRGPALCRGSSETPVCPIQKTVQGSKPLPGGGCIPRAPPVPGSTQRGHAGWDPLGWRCPEGPELNPRPRLRSPKEAQPHPAARDPDASASAGKP